MVVVQYQCALLPPRNASEANETKGTVQLARKSIQKNLYAFFLLLVMHNPNGVIVYERNTARLESVLCLELRGRGGHADDRAIVAVRWQVGMLAPRKSDVMLSLVHRTGLHCREVCGHEAPPR